jgi:hypothetical protein
VAQNVVAANSLERKEAGGVAVGCFYSGAAKAGKKRGRCCQRPEFREETPKKGEATIACCNATLA